jgi:hypothetical protein
MSDLRHIHDPVLSFLKMKGIRLLTFICLRRSYISYDLVHPTFTAQVRDVSTCAGARVVEGGLGTIT